MRVQAAILAILFPFLATAAPPKPAAEKVTVAVGELTRVEVVADAAGVVGWASGAAESDLFVDELAPRGGKTRLLIQAKRAGTYRLVLWSKGETDSTFVEVVAGAGAAPVDPVKPDPVKPTTVYYFAVVGAEGPVSPAVAAVMKLPAWDELRKAGHVVNYIPANELSSGLTRPLSLPAVMTLKKDGAAWVDTGANKPLPTNDDAIRGLLR